MSWRNKTLFSLSMADDEIPSLRKLGQGVNPVAVSGNNYNQTTKGRVLAGQFIL
jgi:hypothetical protein